MTASVNTERTYGAIELASAVVRSEVVDRDADTARRLGEMRQMDTIALVQRIDAFHAFLTQREYRKTYPVGSAKRAIVGEWLIELCRHYLQERHGQGDSARDYYMGVWADAHAETAKNLRAQIKRNQAAR